MALTFDQWLQEQGYSSTPNPSAGYSYSPDPDTTNYVRQPEVQDQYAAYLRAADPAAFAAQYGGSAWGVNGPPINPVDGTPAWNWNQPYDPETNYGPPPSNQYQDTVQLNGQTFRRLGNDFNNQSLMQFAPGVQPVYDQTYGWLMPEDQFRMAQSQLIGPDSFGETFMQWLPAIAAAALTAGGIGGALGGVGAGAGEAAAGGAAGSSAAGSGAALGAAEGASAGFTPGVAAAGSYLGAGSPLLGSYGTGATLGSLGGAGGALGAGMTAADVSTLLSLGYSASDIAAAGGSAGLEALGGAGGAATGAGGVAAAGSGTGNLLSSAGSGLGDLLKTPGLSQLLGSGINALGGYLGSQAQAGAAKDANQILLDMYNQNRADQAPYRAAGYNALGNMVNLTTPGKQLDTAMLDPGYAFRQSEGQKALDNKLRAGGNFYSGQSLKDSAAYNQNFATGEFGNVFNRNASIAGLGQTATNATQQAGQQTATGVANNTVDIGNARASGYGAIGGGINNGLNAYSNAQQQQQMMDLFSAYLKNKG